MPRLLSSCKKNATKCQLVRQGWKSVLDSRRSAAGHLEDCLDVDKLVAAGLSLGACR